MFEVTGNFTLHIFMSFFRFRYIAATMPVADLEFGEGVLNSSWGVGEGGLCRACGPAALPTELCC